MAPSAISPVALPLLLLLAEDNAINQKLVLLLLRAANHDVQIVENGAQAVEAVRDGDYDAVLMDLQMPVLDGATATKRIRALPQVRSTETFVYLKLHKQTYTWGTR